MASLETTLEQERVARLKAEEELILFKRMMRTSRLDEMEEELRQLRQALAEQKRSATAKSRPSRARRIQVGASPRRPKT